MGIDYTCIAQIKRCIFLKINNCDYYKYNKPAKNLKDLYSKS